MAKKLRFLFTLLFIMAATVSWGEDKTVTLTQSSLGLTGSYTSNTEKTIDGITYVYSDLMKNNTDIQAKASTGTIYNKTIFPSNIKNVAITHSGTARATTILGSSDGENWTQVIAGSGSITADFSGKDYKYFKITRGSNAAYWEKIEITYVEESSGPVDPKVSFENESLEVEVESTKTNAINKPSDLTVSYSSSNENVATVDATNGEVTGVAEGTATITASWAAVANTYNAGSKSYTVTVIPAPTMVQYQLVSNVSELSDGDEILFVNQDGTRAMSSTQKTNNRDGVVVSAEKGVLSLELNQTAVQVINLEGGSSDWYFNVGNGYLYAASSKDNHMKTQTNKNDNSKARISISEEGEATIIFQGSNTRNNLRYNANSELFSCYGSTNDQQKINIYKKVTAASSVATPTFSPAAGAYFEAQSVRITCETADAKIYYTLDGTDPTSASTLYESAIPISETTTLKAIAIKDNESSNVATAEYTIAPTYENNNAANVAATSTDSPVRLTLTEALVVYKNGNNTYLKDASGGMLIYGENNLNVGDKVTGHVDGDLTLYNGLPEIKNPVFSVSTVSQNNEVTATVVDAADLKANPMKYVNQYVKVSPAKFAEDFTGSTSNATNANFTVGETELILRNSFKLGVEVSKDKDYAISGMATIFIKDGVTNIQLYPTNTDSDIEELHFVAQVGEQKYGTLQDAFDAAEATEPALEDIVIDLLDDAELTISPRSNIRAIGTANTKSITINGNSHKLTFMTTDTDWNDVSTRNDTQTRLVLSDMTIDQAGKNDKKTWNSYDINFNCAVELNNVTSNKPIAFKNDATLKNVTINDTSGDYYGIWISPRVEGQNISIDGLTLTAGRGIKVDDQYVDNPEKVTLDIKNATFNTTKKSAILVKSKAETAITVGEDVNIENVAADKVNTVWVDEDYADEFYKVAVEGATVVPESKEADYDACLMKGDQRWGFYEKVSSAIEKVEDGYSIKLFRTTTEAVTVVKTLTIVKNGFTAVNVVAGEGFVRIETDTEIKIISASAVPTTPVVFHDSGEYEAGLSVPMYAQAGEIYYTINGGTKTKYTAPLTVSEKTTVVAWTEIDGVESEKVTRVYTIADAAEKVTAFDGYYSIKNGTGKYINVAGRKTVTFVADGDKADKAGTVIKVKTNDKGQVEELRSQGVDLPGYAKKAMNYVPEIVQLVVDKLDAEGQGKILGENGLDAIMKKFNESFDYNLYLEKAGEGYRIYGKTPSMKPVVDFYAENKANVDIKLPQLEDFINKAIKKVREKTNGHGASILTDFSLEEIWEKMGKTLTEPKDEASTAKFYEEVLSSEANVWNFAYQTAMKYWEPLIKHDKVKDNLDNLGDYAKYLEKVENIRPNFKYYIVANEAGNDVDFISGGNIDIQNNAARTIWTMNERNNGYKVTFNEENAKNGGTEYYTTLYTDFGYKLAEGMKAYKVAAVDDKGYAKLEEIKATQIPAQTPVLLMTTDLTKTTVEVADGGEKITGENLLVGPDYLINKYQIKTAQVEGLFNLAKDIMGESFYDKYVKEYEHLMMRNAGTVNNKYFFGMTVDGDVSDAYKAKTGNTMESSPIRILGPGENKLGFYSSWEALKANEAFIVNEEFDPVKLVMIGDVTRDGKVDVEDVTAVVTIILTEKEPPYGKYPQYDYDAADTDDSGVIDVTDLTNIVNMSLEKTGDE